MRRNALLAVPLLLATVPAWAEPAPPVFSPGTTVRVVRVIDGDTLELADGSALRLAAIAAPRPVPARRTEADRREPALPIAAHSRQRLRELAENRAITLLDPAPANDRYGRRVAHAATEDGAWLQADLVARGLARVETTAESAVGAARLLRLEAEARDQRRGIWALAAFRVLAPAEAGRWIDSFQLVEGTARADGRSVSRLRIERDGAQVLVRLAQKARAELRHNHRDLPALFSQPVRVRGWVRWHNGAVIDVSHAAQVEPLNPPAD